MQKKETEGGKEAREGTNDSHEPAEDQDMTDMKENTHMHATVSG